MSHEKNLFLPVLAILLFLLIPELINHSEQTVIGQIRSDNTSFFPLGAMNNQTDYDHYYITDPEMFGMNLWHLYTGSTFNSITGKYMPQGWSIDSADKTDSLFADFNTFWPSIQLYLNKQAGEFNLDDPNFKMKMLMQRPKLEWLSYGQRSDYQCENISMDDYKWFYAFQSPGYDWQDVPDDDQMVRYCRKGIDPAGIVVSRLKTNNEQNNTWFDTTYYHGDDSQWKWYIKPRIRIDANFANSNPQAPVCEITIINSDDSIIKTTIIKGINFLDEHGKYYGQYLEEFYNFKSTDDSLTINGAWGSMDRRRPRGNDIIDGNGISKMDIQIYWYGNCDMWLDYVRVDNEIAHDLLTSKPTPNHLLYEQWLQWEAITANYKPLHGFKPQYKFYIEEFEFNNIPCIAYVNKKLQELTSPDTVDMMACYYYGQFTNHLPFNYIISGKWTDNKKLDAEVIDSVLIKATAMRQFFTEIYPFTSNEPQYDKFSKVPNTFETGNNYVYANQVSPAEYDFWLQNFLDNPDFPTLEHEEGWFTNAVKLADELSKRTGKPFITMPQTHNVQTRGIENRREPTMEEINLTTNLALSYGSKGIIFFWYGGGGKSDSVNYNSAYGFLDSSRGNQYFRTINTYGQNKWEGLIGIHKHIRKWMPYLISFNNNGRQSYIYRDKEERNELIKNTYFNDIKVYTSSSESLDKRSLTEDSAHLTYLQAAVFQNDEMNSSYFMIINRRASPYIKERNENGGSRYIRIKLDKNSKDFSLFHKWKITDVSDNTVVKEFNKKAGSYIDLGWYLPGEGKLYRIEPSINSGPVSVNK